YEAYELEVGRPRLHRLKPREQVARRRAPGAEIDAAARPDRHQRLLQAHELRVVVSGFLTDHVPLHREDALNDGHVKAPAITLDIPSIGRIRAIMGRTGASDDRARAESHGIRCLFQEDRLESAHCGDLARGGVGGPRYRPEIASHRG